MGGGGTAATWANSINADSPHPRGLGKALFGGSCGRRLSRRGRLIGSPSPAVPRPSGPSFRAFYILPYALPALPGAGNARNFVCGRFLFSQFRAVKDSNPALPGAGNARQNFGGRFLRQIMNHKRLHKPSENARKLFAGIFLRSAGRIEMDKRSWTRIVTWPRARLPD